MRRWWPVLAVTGLLALTALTASRSALRFRPVEPPGDGDEPVRAPEAAPTATMPTTDPPPFADAEPGNVPDWLATAAGVICLLVVAVAVVVLVRVLFRDALARRRSPMPDAKRAGSTAGRTAQEVVAALDAGLVDLDDTDLDPRRAVIACWVRLEQAAAAAGVPRQVGDTSTDLVTRLLSQHTQVSAEVLATFADVYRTARYATHAVDERMREHARSALHRLRGELTATTRPETAR